VAPLTQARPPLHRLSVVSHLACKREVITHSLGRVRFPRVGTEEARRR
jgi:hypothetical protein